MKLKARMKNTTAATGHISHGANRMVRSCRASCSITPQLITGSWSPSPRKLSAVSPRIMPGIDRVSDAIRWLITPGITCTNITRLVEPLSSWAAIA